MIACNWCRNYGMPFSNTLCSTRAREMQNCYYPQPTQPRKDDAPLKRPDTVRVSPDEMRRPFMQLDAVSGAAGSAYVELGRTRVICAVYGPRNDTRPRREFSKDGQLVCDVKFAPFAEEMTRRERGQDSDEMELSAILEEALTPAVMLHKLPKCVLSVFLTVLEDDGGVIAASINCASLALADAAVEMYDVVTASSAGVVNGTVLLDPLKEEEQSGQGKLALAYMPSVGRVTFMLQSGKIHHTQLQEAVDLCTDACTGVTRSLVTASLVQALI
ncbi:putative ribosomal protein S5 domain 2-type [Plasmopara halstedii]